MHQCEDYYCLVNLLTIYKIIILEVEDDKIIFTLRLPTVTPNIPPHKSCLNFECCPRFLAHSQVERVGHSSDETKINCICPILKAEPYLLRTILLTVGDILQS